LDKLRNLLLYLIAVSERRKSLIRVGLVLTFVGITAFILPQPAVMEFSYEVGRPWTNESLIAPFDFSKEKPEDIYQQEIKERIVEVPEVYLLESNVLSKVKRNTETYLNESTILLKQYRQALKQGQEDKSEKTAEKLAKLTPPILTEEIPLEDLDSKYIDELLPKSREILDRLYQNGILSKLKSDISSNSLSLRNSASEEELRGKEELLDMEEATELIQQGSQEIALGNILKNLLTKEVKVNFIINEDLFREDREAAKDRVLRNYGKIKKGEVIVSRGQIVSEDIQVAIQSLVHTKQGEGNGFNYFSVGLGKCLAILLMVSMLIIFLRTHRSRIFYRNRKLALLLLVVFMVTVLSVLMIQINYQVGYALNYLYLAPVCMAPILVTVFFDGRLAMFVNVLAAFIIGMVAPNAYEFVFIQVLAGTTAVYSLRKFRNRSAILKTASWIFLTSATAFLAYNLFIKGSFESIAYANLILLAINALLNIIIYPLISVFERIFGITSDLTFIELLDTQHPVLKELSSRAPGTFQHSLQVASLAEAVTDQIGGNGLKARVGALFHDIGKMKNPNFFIENQMPGINPHHELTPEQSAVIIIGHVQEGLRLAREYNLPSEIVDFIRTHHGTSRVEYFYRTHLQKYRQLPDTNDFSFRYKGPLPPTRETAVVMVADSVEAASRALANPTEEELKVLVEHIIQYKIQEQQFENCGISFSDVRKMKEILTRMLISIYHHRVEYPK